PPSRAVSFRGRRPADSTPRPPRPPAPTCAHLRPPAPTCGVLVLTVALSGFWALRTPITQRSTVIEWRSATPGPASDEKTPGPAAAARSATRIRTMAAEPGAAAPLEASQT